MTSQHVADDLETLFESSPARDVRTSAAAGTAFLAGLVAVLGSPFSLLLVLCLVLAAVGLVTGVVGLARASRPAVAGGLLASIGLVLSLATLALVGLRYLGIDTAVGDGWGPAIHDALVTLNGLVPAP